MKFHARLHSSVKGIQPFSWLTKISCLASVYFGLWRIFKVTYVCIYIFLLNEVVYYSKGENNQDMTLNL